MSNKISNHISGADLTSPDFHSNEYGVHYALLSCYRRRRQIIHSIEDSEPEEELESEGSGGPLSYTVVASGSAGLASGFFLDPQGPGQKCLASWAEFCTVRQTFSH